MTSGTEQWAAAFTSATAADPVIQSMAKYYTCAFLLDMESVSILVRMQDGAIKEIMINPGPLEPYQFALRASADTWRKMSEEHPPPFYQGILAAAAHHDLKIEGDTLVLMQNLRNFTAHITLLKRVGVPV